MLEDRVNVTYNYVTGDKQSNSGGVTLIYESAFTEKLGQVVRRIMSEFWMSGR